MTKKDDATTTEATSEPTSTAPTSKATKSPNRTSAGARQVSSAGEKGIKPWFGAGGKREYVLAGLAFGLGLIGGAVVRAMGRIFEGTAIW